ncbi:N-acetylglucosamine-6-phosphate deacetylase [Pedobacter sp. HMF7647]|uniref:N-acetylglucosamine-6-phosphate deacetylase n=1 Tax=Hufsiella arboris TaxID=2695275 RepID=A0A7K1Y6G6_9SPHI|nr:N-acetylglucosamine-6-phosphate deacetylase [Hufsiella arboris]MXV50030.1 N-acetylglucosamine-6-phosphate deacetylase [Hufsiella arboris]
MKIAYTNCIVVTNGSELHGKAVITEGNIISDIVSENNIPQDCRQHDLDGAFISPGFIDLQIYGSGGKLFGGVPTADALAQMEADLLSQGTTGFLGAVATNTPAIVQQAVDAAKDFRNRSQDIFIGLHLEGPYLNPKRKGAHPADLIKKGSLEELKSWVESAKGEIKMMTIAPELQDQELIDYLKEQQIIISAGHSDADYRQACSAFSNGVAAATHLYNAMPQLHHREPGLVAGIFHSKPFTSIVADGVHVSFPMIEIAKRQLQEKLYLITDAVTETNEGIYQHVLNGDRYTMPDGTLSGSSLTMLKAVQNCVTEVNIDLPEAVNMASLYPATVIGLNESLGTIEHGKQANMAIFDQNFKIKGTVFQGNYIENAG